MKVHIAAQSYTYSHVRSGGAVVTGGVLFISIKKHMKWGKVLKRITPICMCLCVCSWMLFMHRRENCSICA